MFDPEVFEAVVVAAAAAAVAGWTGRRRILRRCLSFRSAAEYWMRCQRCLHSVVELMLADQILTGLMVVQLIVQS